MNISLNWLSQYIDLEGLDTKQMADMLLELYDSDATVGSIDFATRGLKLSEPKHPHL